MILFFLSTILFNYSNDVAARAINIDYLLKTRGQTASKRLEILERTASLSQEEVCRMEYERIYSSFANPEKAKEVKQQLNYMYGSNSVGYVLAINDKGVKTFQMKYIYIKDSSEPIISEVETIKEGWLFKMTPDLPNIVAVTSDKCVYQFNLSNPLDSSVNPL